MIAAVGLGLDGARIFLERREAQAAADLAALSGARSLPGDLLQAESDAITVAGLNGHSISGDDVIVPYDGDDGKIRVDIPSEVDTAFLPVLHVLGIDDFDTIPVSAHAVAEHMPASGYGEAVFAAEIDCSDKPKEVLVWPANAVTVNGGVHSNGGISVTGNENEAHGGTTYTCAGQFEDNGSTNVFDPAATSTGTSSDWPVVYHMWDASEPDDFNCDFTSSTTGEWNLGGDGAWWVGGSANAMSPPELIAGTYCAPNGTIRLDVNNVEGEITIIAAVKVSISGQNLTLTPHENGVLILSFGTGNEAVTVNTEGGTWEGLILAYNGTASIRGQSGFQLFGGIHAYNVKLDGNGFSITNLTAEGDSGHIALIE